VEAWRGEIEVLRRQRDHHGFPREPALENRSRKNREAVGHQVALDLSHQERCLHLVGMAGFPGKHEACPRVRELRGQEVDDRVGPHHRAVVAQEIEGSVAAGYRMDLDRRG